MVVLTSHSLKHIVLFIRKKWGKSDQTWNEPKQISISSKVIDPKSNLKYSLKTLISLITYASNSNKGLQAQSFCMYQYIWDKSSLTREASKSYLMSCPKK